MDRMFKGGTGFDQDIRGWDVGNVENFEDMFKANTAFNGDIGHWNTASATSMRWMFKANNVFDRPVGDWDVGNVVDFEGMFDNAQKFKQHLDGWQLTTDASKTITMQAMFQGASLFNGRVPFDTARVTHFQHMFRGTALDQPVRFDFI